MAYLARMFGAIAFNAIDPVEWKQIDAAGSGDGRGGAGGNDMGYGRTPQIGRPCIAACYAFTKSA